MIFHLILVSILVLASASSTVMFFGGFGPVVEGKGTTERILNGCLTTVVMAMMVMGVVYLLKQYSKKAAGYYKAFLLLLCVVVSIDIVMDLICGEMNVWLISKITLYAVKVILLLVLAFWKDLGKKKTFCICYIIFAIDVVGLAMELLYMSENGFYIDPIIGVTAALIADGASELSVNGKYKDKEMRGSN